MKLVAKVCRIAREQGMASLTYIASDKLKNKLPVQQKYKKYRKNEKRARARLLSNKPSFQELFTVVVPGEEVFGQLDEVTTPYVAFLEEGDRLENSWQQVAGSYLKRHPECRMLYSDEDRLEKLGRWIPVFKPDWSPDTYMCYDYVGGLLVMDRELAVATKERICSKYKSSFLYELGLLAAFSLDAYQIGHIPQVLYHRLHSQTLPKEQLLALKEQVLKERRIKGKVYWRSFSSSEEGFYNPCGKEDKNWANLWINGCADVIYEVPKEPLVSIVVPSKDHWELLKTCVETVEAYTNYQNVEWIVVDNGSNPEQKKKYEELCDTTRFPCRYVYEPMEFNFSRMCNLGARAAQGEYLLFLNDDMELIPKCEDFFDGTDVWSEDSVVAREDWLSRMLGQAALPYSGAVGAKLLYPNSTKIQHLGVVNYTSGAAHLLWQANDRKVLPFGRNHTTQNYSVVTGACLLIQTEKFWQVGGFEERLAVTFNDVELCLKLLEAGYYQTVRSDVIWYHHESISRGQDVLDEKKFLRGLKEREIMFNLHPKYIGVDPFYSRYLTQTRLDHTLDYPTTYELSKERTKKRKAEYSGEGDQLVYRLLRVTEEEDVRMEGWAYRKGHSYEPICVGIRGANGEFGIYEAQKVYTPTITKEQQSEHNLNFAGFDCRISREQLPEGEYSIELFVGK